MDVSDCGPEILRYKGDHRVVYEATGSEEPSCKGNEGDDVDPIPHLLKTV